MKPLLCNRDLLVQLISILSLCMSNICSQLNKGVIIKELHERDADPRTELFFFSNSFWVQQERDGFCPPGEVELMYSKRSHALIIATLEQLPLWIVFQNK